MRRRFGAAALVVQARVRAHAPFGHLQLAPMRVRVLVTLASCAGLTCIMCWSHLRHVLVTLMPLAHWGVGADLIC